MFPLRDSTNSFRYVGNGRRIIKPPKNFSPSDYISGKPLKAQQDISTKFGDVPSTPLIEFNTPKSLPKPNATANKYFGKIINHHSESQPEQNENNFDDDDLVINEVNSLLTGGTSTQVSNEVSNANEDCNSENEPQFEDNISDNSMNFEGPRRVEDEEAILLNAFNISAVCLPFPKRNEFEDADEYNRLMLKFLSIHPNSLTVSCLVSFEKVHKKSQDIRFNITPAYLPLMKVITFIPYGLPFNGMYGLTKEEKGSNMVYNWGKWAIGDYGVDTKGLDPYTLENIDHGLYIASVRIVWFLTKGLENNLNYDPDLPTIISGIVASQIPFIQQKYDDLIEIVRLEKQNKQLNDKLKRLICGFEPKTFSDDTLMARLRGKLINRFEACKFKPASENSVPNNETRKKLSRNKTAPGEGYPRGMKCPKLMLKNGPESVQQDSIDETNLRSETFENDDTLSDIDAILETIPKNVQFTAEDISNENKAQGESKQKKKKKKKKSKRKLNSSNWSNSFQITEN